MGFAATQKRPAAGAQSMHSTPENFALAGADVDSSDAGQLANSATVPASGLGIPAATAARISATGQPPTYGGVQPSRESSGALLARVSLSLEARQISLRSEGLVEASKVAPSPGVPSANAHSPRDSSSIPADAESELAFGTVVARYERLPLG